MKLIGKGIRENLSEKQFNDLNIVRPGRGVNLVIMGVLLSEEITDRLVEVVALALEKDKNWLVEKRVSPKGILQICEVILEQNGLDDKVVPFLKDGLRSLLMIPEILGRPEQKKRKM